jgi:hypothetical protein
MAFGEPKPRNIEKDLKVFQWDILPAAVQKIISKYVSLIGGLSATVYMGPRAD